MSLSSIFSKPVILILAGLAVMAELDNILGFIARQADRVITSLGHYSLKIAIGAAILGLVVHLSPWHADHGWKVIERSAIFLCGVALIPVLYPILQSFFTGPAPRLLANLLNGLAAGLSGV